MVTAEVGGTRVVFFEQEVDYADVLESVVTDHQAERVADRYARRLG